jgi:hypothetical protein
MTGDLWEMRGAEVGLALELHGGDQPALVLRQAGQAIGVQADHTKGLVAALVDGAADPSPSLRTGLAEALSRGARGRAMNRGKPELERSER